MGIRTVGAEEFHENNQDRHDEANGRFSQFYEGNLKNFTTGDVFIRERVKIVHK